MMPNNFIPGKGNWALFFVAAFLMFINFFMSMTVLPYYVLQLGWTEFLSGFQNAVFLLAVVLLRFYFGPLADRKGRKIPLMIGAFVFATTPLFFLLHSDMWVVITARIYQAIGPAAFLSSGSALVADMAPAGKTGTYMGAYRLLITLSLLSGPPAALSLINMAGFNAWFVASIIIGFLSLLLVALVKTPDLPCEKSGSLRLSPLKGSMYTILSGIAVTSLGFGTILSFAVVFLSQFELIANPGVYFVYFGLGGIAANLSAGYLSDRFGHPVVAWPALMLFGMGLMGLFFAPYTTVVLIPAAIAAGVGHSGGLLVLISWLIDLSDKRARAVILSIQESIIDASVAIGTLLLALAGRWVELSTAFAAIGFFIFAIAIALLVGLRRGKSSPAEQGTEY